ncbi:inorganic pyrophosphatase [Bacilli bacterium PM5-3]|nr:inorganic pyrophosphatase [Bacilli bacterium PM5-3]MDH6603628.1 inorganic pyrophosphatase [Bacilli bacterium PM5-9]
MNDTIVEALIEIPQGSQNKYEVDKDKDRIILDRPLYSAMLYPAEYGYIENTLAKDGDPIDILVFASFPTFPGCIIESRIVGMLEMTDSGDEDVKLIAVSNRDPRFSHVKSLEDLPPHYLTEVRHFFDTYKELQKKKVETGAWQDVEVALKYLEDSIERYNKTTK